MKTIASEPWPSHLPDKDLVFHVIWKAAREVERTFEDFRRWKPRDVEWTTPVPVEELVSFGFTVIMAYGPRDFRYLESTLKKDMIDEARRLMVQAGFEWDKSEKKWKERADIDAPWMYGRGSPLFGGPANDQESEAFTSLEDEYPAIVALARTDNGLNESEAARSLGVPRTTFRRMLESERLKIQGDSEIMAALKRKV